MLPVLFTLTIPPSLGIVVWLALSAASGGWQVRSARAAGEKDLWKTFGTWTAGTAAVLYLAVKVLGGQNILHLERPLAIPVHTYGILVAAGFLVAMTLAARAADRSGLNRDKVLDLSFGILVAAMIGSRILFIIVNWDEYAHDLAGIFQFWKGGLVFYGGFIGAVLFSALIFLFLTYWRSRKRFHGELLALYLMLYAPLRAVVETFRGDEERGRVFNFLGGWARHAWWNLSTSELISIGIFAAGLAIYVTRGRRAYAATLPVAA